MLIFRRYRKGTSAGRQPWVVVSYVSTINSDEMCLWAVSQVSAMPINIFQDSNNVQQHVFADLTLSSAVLFIIFFGFCCLPKLKGDMQTDTA